MVPEGWKVLTIEKMAKVTSGGTPSRSKSEYWEGSVPWVTTAEVHFNTIYDTKQKITLAGLENSSAKLFPPKTILMAMYGQGKTRGQVAQLGIEASTNQACSAILLKKDFFPEYYYLYLQSQYKNIRNLSNSGGQKNLSARLVKSILVPVPPFLEQTKIAKILSTWDQAIETTEKLIKNSRAQKKALMQQLLSGERRLPGFNEKSMQVTINQMGKIVSGGTPDTQNPSFWNGDIAWTTPTDITALESRFIKHTKRNITVNGMNNSSAQLLPVGSILVCTRATIGYLAISSSEISTNQGFKSLIPNNDFDSDFIYYLFKYYKHLFIKFACGSTFLEISKKDFSQLTFKVPTIDEQKGIAIVLNNAGNDIRKFEETRTVLLNEKKALMQQLLTGKRRVKP
ncbi:Type I restriction-modification system, specificity subunit S [hydrothermal vent metagenome]|uniref:Type I restriction-modification system, specificity subunit S n=1 Tax=hydrothermal vent metagenome TaxID=652676 RepID=A0A3B1B7D2_9ZZZZ